MKGVPKPCPTCGSPKRYHSEQQWEAHRQMHNSYLRIQADIRRILARAAKEGGAK